MAEALVVRCVGGYVWVQQPGGPPLRVRPRGKLRQQGRLRVGDRVRLACTSGLADEATAPSWTVEAVEPRQTLLDRPPIANISQILLVSPLPLDEGALRWIDQVAVAVQQRGVTPSLVFTKADLAGPEAGERAAQLYRRAGYRALVVCAPRQEGLLELRGWLRGQITALAGPSGAGKSTLINSLIPGLDVTTGEVSRRIGRGRQTTREVQLFALPGDDGWIADTPGFGALDLQPVAPGELARYFPELAAAPPCLYPDCLHEREPGCQVKASVSAGQMAASRYQHYLELLAWTRQEWQRRYERAASVGSRRPSRGCLS